MPSPQRVVRRSLAMLRSLGYSDVAALVLVRSLAREVSRQLAEAGFTDLDWLEQVAAMAKDRLDGSRTSDTDSRETDHGNGTGSTTGSTTGQ